MDGTEFFHVHLAHTDIERTGQVIADPWREQKIFWFCLKVCLKYNVFYIPLYHNPQFHNFLSCRILKNFEDFVLVEGFHIERRLSPLVENWWSHGIIMHHLSTKLILQRILENCEIVPPTQLFPTILRNLENAHFNEKKRAFMREGRLSIYHDSNNLHIITLSSLSLAINCWSFPFTAIWKVPQ